MNNQNPTQDNLLIQAYTPAGFKVSISVIGWQTAHEIDAVLKEAGYLNQLPGVEAGENVETITTVVRREHVNGKTGEITPVIDCYPEWRGDYGQFRFVGIYLNSADEIREFEAQSGLKLENMPLYESQAPIQRNQARANRHEIACKPFRVKKAEDREKEVGGKMQMTYKFSGYLSPVNPPAAQPEHKPTGNGNGGSNGSNVPESVGKMSERNKSKATPTNGSGGVLWFTDSAEIKKFTDAHGLPAGTAAKRLQKELIDFPSVDALINAYAAAINPQ